MTDVVQHLLGDDTDLPGARWEITPALTADDVAAVTALCTAATDVDGVHPLSEHVTLHLRHGGDGHDRHLLVRRDDTQDGDQPPRLLGYAHLDPTDSVAGAVAEVVVHPAVRGHGIGRVLVEAAVAQTAGGRLRLWAHGDHPAARALAASLGFTEGRRLEQWRRSLFSPLPPVALPDGVRIRTFEPGTDDDAWLRLNARAFAHHPEQGGWTHADLQARLAERWFDAAGFLLVETVDDVPRLVAFHWTKVHGSTSHRGADNEMHAHEAIGEVYVVGVDPAEQGRGLGRAVTVAGLHRLRALGLPQAMLYVEGDNVTAQAVYRGLGFAHWDTDVMFYPPSGPAEAPAGG